MFLNNDIFSIKKGIPWQQDGDKALILDADEHFAHELNSTALFIWQNINTPKSYKQLCSNFINEFDACLLYTSPSPRDATLSRMPSSA